MPASKAAQQNKMRNKILARIGYLSARYGATPESVSAAMYGQVSPDQVAEAWRVFDFRPPVLLPGQIELSVALSGRHRTMICKEAFSRGMELPELASALLTKTAQDQLFGALLDG